MATPALPQYVWLVVMGAFGEGAPVHMKTLHAQPGCGQECDDGREAADSLAMPCDAPPTWQCTSLPPPDRVYASCPLRRRNPSGPRARAHQAPLALAGGCRC